MLNRTLFRSVAPLSRRWFGISRRWRWMADRRVRSDGVRGAAGEAAADEQRRQSAVLGRLGGQNQQHNQRSRQRRGAIRGRGAGCYLMMCSVCSYWGWDVSTLKIVFLLEAAESSLDFCPPLPPNFTRLESSWQSWFCVGGCVLLVLSFL